MSRILVLIIAAVVLIGAVFWMSSDNPRGELEQIRADLPNVEMGTGVATIPVPTDAEIVKKEREIDGKTIEYPSVDVTTEDKTIEYPTVEVTPADQAPAAGSDAAVTDGEVKPVMQDPNDPVPAVDAEKAYEDTQETVKENYEDAKDAVNEKIDEMDKNNNGSIVE